MGQILVRNLDDAVIEALKARASARGLSLDAELRDLLTRAAGNRRAELTSDFAVIRALSPRRHHRSAEDLVRESRDER